MASSCLGKLQYSADRLVAETGMIGQVQTELFGRFSSLGEREVAQRIVVGGMQVNGYVFKLGHFLSLTKSCHE